MLYVLLLAIILDLASCEKKNNDQSFPFEAEVLGINMDCGIQAINFFVNFEIIQFPNQCL